MMIILPLGIAAVVANSYLHSIPTAGNDLPLIAGFTALGIALGLVSGLTTRVRADGGRHALVKAGWVAAGAWVLGMGFRFGFSIWANNGSRPLRRVLPLAEGRRAVHRRPPRRGRLPDRRGAGAPREHLLEHGRALLAGARLRRIPRAPAGRAGRVPPPAARASPMRWRPPRRCSHSTTPSSRRRSPPTMSTSRTPHTSCPAPTSRRRSTRSSPPRRC